MAEIKTRPATPEYRDNWDRIFKASGGVKLLTKEEVVNMDAEFLNGVEAWRVLMNESVHA